VTIFGVDVHPRYQAGLDIERVAREGFSWCAVKVSQGTSTYPGGEWLTRAERAGMVALPYHYLEAGNEAAQARTCKGVAGNRAVMLDVEKGSGNVRNVRAFLDESARIGMRVPLLYLPRWYWQQIGSPSLAGLPWLVASHYVSGSGYASTLYAATKESWWDGYGGAGVAILQFTDKASVAGKNIDANAYRGTVAQLRELLGAAPPTPSEGTVSAAEVWNAPVNNLYGPDLPTMPAHASLEWACANSAHANENAAAALKAIQDLTAALVAKGAL
jgi:hypothetical protein